MHPHTLDGKYKLRRKPTLTLVGIIGASVLVQMVLPESQHVLRGICEDFQFMAIGILIAGHAAVWEPDVSSKKSKAPSAQPPFRRLNTNA